MDLADSVAGEEDPGAALDLPPSAPGPGNNVCPRCGGSGKLTAETCPDCHGTGKVTVGIGSA